MTRLFLFAWKIMPWLTVLMKLHFFLVYYCWLISWANFSEEHMSIYIRASYINRSCNDSSLHIAKNPPSHLHSEVSVLCEFPQLTLFEVQASLPSGKEKSPFLSEIDKPWTRPAVSWLCHKGHCKLQSCLQFKSQLPPWQRAAACFATSAPVQQSPKITHIHKQ